MVIAIGRQYGSGGRRIGKIIAERLNLQYYDSELLGTAAEKLGLSRQIFAAHDEKAPSSLRNLFQATIGLGDGFNNDGLSNERIYAEQSQVIREIYRKGNCLIVGRTADYILRDKVDLISVFLHAPLEIRAQNIMLRGEASDLKEAKAKARKFDRERENYYNFYIGSKKWGKASNYTICLDSSVLPETDIADIVINFALKKTEDKNIQR